MAASSDLDRQIEQLRRCEIIKVRRFLIGCLPIDFVRGDSLFIYGSVGIGSESLVCDGTRNLGGRVKRAAG